MSVTQLSCLQCRHAFQPAISSIGHGHQPLIVRRIDFPSISLKCWGERAFPGSRCLLDDRSLPSRPLSSISAASLCGCRDRIIGQFTIDLSISSLRHPLQCGPYRENQAVNTRSQYLEEGIEWKASVVGSAVHLPHGSRTLILVALRPQLQYRTISGEWLAVEREEGCLLCRVS